MVWSYSCCKVPTGYLRLWGSLWPLSALSDCFGVSDPMQVSSNTTRLPRTGLFVDGMPEQAGAKRLLFLTTPLWSRILLVQILLKVIDLFPGWFVSGFTWSVFLLCFGISFWQMWVSFIESLSAVYAPVYEAAMDLVCVHEVFVSAGCACNGVLTHASPWRKKEPPGADMLSTGVRRE